MNFLSGEGLNRKPARNWRGKTPKITFEPLSDELLKEAIKVANSVFLNDVNREENPELSYRAGLHPEKHKEDIERFKFKSLQHWAAVTKKKIVGVTGLYRLLDDPADRVWLDWYCISPKKRKHGYGHAVLDFTINEAKEQGYEKMRLWTTDDPNEVAAQKLYESYEFNIIGEDKNPNDDYTRIIREKVLKD